MEYTFSLSFRTGPKPGKVVSFQLDLTDSEVEYIKEYLRKNGLDCDYGEMEFDNQSLFDKINDSANEAVLLSVNEERISVGENELDFDDVDWAYISFDFYWPVEMCPGRE